tara:strand:- start:131 stop:424 length:294 start_codon:yes stop_codon:yes gene_type:complete
MVYDIDERYWDKVAKGKASVQPTGGMNRFDLRTFQTLIESSDIIYGGVQLNSAQTLKARIRKKSLLAALDELDERPYQSFFASVSVDAKGRKIVTLT